MPTSEAKVFLKEFYELQLDKYGKEELLERWYAQEDEVALKLAEERKIDTESMSKGFVHVCMPNSVRYGPERLHSKYRK
ncbi:hypothetical protein BCT67_08155 [Vibrio breoganii]|nr:hypothetical protein BCT67_08155 [Vibrio breoganii]